MTARTTTSAALAGLLATACLAPPAAAAEHTFDLDETYAISPDGTIELSTHDASVTIVGSDRDDVHVEIHYLRRIAGVEFGDRDFEVDISQSRGDLGIRELPRNRSAIGVQQIRYDVLIEAPSGVDLKIRGDDDDYEITDIDGAIALEADDGRIRLRSCRGTAFDLAFGDGELDMDRGAGTLRLRYDDGEADISGAAFDRIRAQANDGTLRLAGDLARDGEYDFEFDDGDMNLRLGEAAGDFSFTFADGSLDLEGGGGNIEIRYDDGNVRLSGGVFQRMTLQANDGDLDFDAPVPPGAVYAIRLDDGNARFNARGGGGRVSAHFDDGRVKAGDSLRLVSQSRHQSTYEWGQGDAEVDIQFNDGSVRLSSRGG